MLVSGRLEKDASVMAADVRLFSTSNQVSSWKTHFSMPRLKFGIQKFGRQQTTTCAMLSAIASGVMISIYLHDARLHDTSLASCS
jgi:hypothetical protein